jgi:hypothetical protein
MGTSFDGENTMEELEHPSQHAFINGFSTLNHPFWGTPTYGNLHITI